MTPVSKAGKFWLGGAVICALLAGLWGPGVFTFRLWRARTSLESGDLPAALPILSRLEQSSPASPDVQFYLGRAKRRAGLIAEALRHFDNAERLGWNREQIEDQRTLLMVQSGRLQEVEPAFQRLVRRENPDEIAEEIYEAQAKGFLATYRLTDALVCLNFWLQWRPEARQARLWRADVQGRLGNNEDAARDYEVLVSRDPSDSEARRKMADIFFNLNRVQDAEREFQVCLKMDSSDLDSRVGLARCLRRQGHSELCEREFQELLKLELSPFQRAEVLVELGEQATFRQQSARAVELLSEAARLDPLNPRVYYPLSLACGKLNEHEQARHFAARNKQLMEASNRLHDLTEQIQKRPQSADLRYEAGRILRDVGMRPEGAAWMHTALLCDPTHQLSHAALADYYAGIKDASREKYHRERVRHDSGHSTERISAQAGLLN